MNVPGLALILRVLGRTQRRAALIWVVGLTASMIGTAAAVAGLYDTPAKIHTYAAAVTSGNALVAINGRVEGVDSLGGVIQNEFGFLAAFLMPLLAISLVAQMTRREEEAGRLEALLASRVSRHAPVLAALAVATAALAATSVGFAAGLVVFGVPLPRAILFATALGALGLVFACLAAVLAQLTEHARGVYTWALICLAVAYLLRGVGDVTRTWVTWLSPLGWVEKAAPFGATQWWTLSIPLVVGLVLAVTAVRLAARRDLGSALVRTPAGRANASASLRRPTGLAWRIHRPATLGWLAGCALFAAMMGGVAQQYVDAILGNAAMARAFGASLTHPMAGYVAVTQLYLAVIATGYAVQAVASLRAQEADGQLETRLAGTLSRTRWLAAHGLVVLGGLVLIVVVGTLVFAFSTAWSIHGWGEVGPTLRAGPAYLPAELLLTGLALMLFGLHPRLLPLAWAAFAGVTFIAFLGPGLRLPSWVLDLAPTTHIGLPPQTPVHVSASTGLALLALLLVLGAFPALRRRGIPQG